MDGIRIAGRHSWDDFGLYIKTRNIALPARKRIRQTVPFCHGSYDFSALGGEVAYEDRTLSYTFDIAADTLSDLEAEKAAVSAWLALVQETEIRDDVVPGCHFVGSTSALSWSPDENGYQGELSVQFVCYPFKISDAPRAVVLEGTSPKTLYLTGFGAAVKAISDSTTTVTNGVLSGSLQPGEPVLLPFTLRHGRNTLSQTGTGRVQLVYYEEMI